MMLRYLLDTDTCIYIAKHHPPTARERLARLKPGQVGMSVITFGELLFGAEKSASKAKAMQVLKQLQQVVPIIDIDAEAAQRYGEIRAHLERAGTPIAQLDQARVAYAAFEIATVHQHAGAPFPPFSQLVHGSTPP